MFVAAIAVCRVMSRHIAAMLVLGVTDDEQLPTPPAQMFLSSTRTYIISIRLFPLPAHFTERSGCRTAFADFSVLR